MVEDDYIPVIQGWKDELHIALALVVAAGQFQRVVPASVHIGRGPAGSGNVGVHRNPDFQTGQNWRRRAISLHISPVCILGARQVDEVNHSAQGQEPCAANGSDDDRQWSG